MREDKNTGERRGYRLLTFTKRMTKLIFDFAKKSYNNQKITN